MGFLGNGLVLGRKTAAMDNADDKSLKTGDINLSNILKLVPGDVVAIYLAGQGYGQSINQGIVTDKIVMGMPWPSLLFWLCLLVCFLLRVLVTAKAPGGINWWLVVVTLIAFFIWAHAVAPTKGPVFASFYGSIAGFVAMLFGVVAPLLVPAEPE